MADEGNDSPAFRLRPRQAAPKSYYTVRLEFSGNPAAFIRDRPRGAKRKSNSSNNLKRSCNSAVAKLREERKHDEKRLRLRREIAQSITTNLPISPFLEQIYINQLQPNTTYEHNYIALNVLRVQQSNEIPLLTCFCQAPQESDTSSDSKVSNLDVNVLLYDEYSNASQVSPGKSISIAKFKTGPKLEAPDNVNLTSKNLLPFNVIVKYVPTGEGSSKTAKDPLIPFLSITNMIE